MMNNRLVFIPGLFALGMLAGIAIMNGRAPEETLATTDEAESMPAPVPAPDPEPSPNPFASAPTRAGADRLQTLQNQYDRLSRRIDRLEIRIDAVAVAIKPEPDEHTAALSPPSAAGLASAATMRTPTADSLIRAGIAVERASDIVRRKNEIELKKLELRDRATREHYLGTSRYNREFGELTANDVTLREELGDDDYDRYLYATGQNNRVRVASVMIGSQAEFAGIQGGDIILSYDDRNLFEWSELQQATTQGERGEYANVNVLRGDQLLNLWVPRGPLGVRLGAARLEP